MPYLRRKERGQCLRKERSIGSSSPMRKLPSPAHYAKAIAFLASDDAEMITGMDLRVDAGTIARYWAWTPEN